MCVDLCSLSPPAHIAVIQSSGKTNKVFGSQHQSQWQRFLGTKWNLSYFSWRETGFQPRALPVWLLNFPIQNHLILSITWWNRFRAQRMLWRNLCHPLITGTDLTQTKQTSKKMALSCDYSNLSPLPVCFSADVYEVTDSCESLNLGFRWSIRQGTSFVSKSVMDQAISNTVSN